MHLMSVRSYVFLHSVLICTTGGSLRADIVTGEYSSEWFTRDSQMVGIDVGIEAGGWSHDDTDYHEIFIDHLSDPSSQAAQFIVPNQGSRDYFREGELISPLGDFGNGIGIGSSSYYKGETYYNLFGEIGEMMFLGFVFNNHTGSGEPLRNYGFLQIQKISAGEFEIIGYAYESENQVPIEAFNLVPAPSGVTLFGACGLCAARRKR